MDNNKIITKGEYVNTVGPTDLENHYLIEEFSDVPRYYKGKFFENLLSSIYGETLEDTRCLYSTSENPTRTNISPVSIFHEIIDPTNETEKLYFLDNIGGNIELYLSYNNIGVQNKLYEINSSFNFELHTWETGEDEIVNEWYWQVSKAKQDVTVIFESDGINFEWFFDKTQPQYLVIRDVWDMSDSFEISLGEHSDVELNFLMFTRERYGNSSNLQYFLRGKCNEAYDRYWNWYNVYEGLEKIGACIYDGEDVYLPVGSTEWGHNVTSPEYIVFDDLNGESYFSQRKFENQIEVEYGRTIQGTSVNSSFGYIDYDIYTQSGDYPFINPFKVEWRVKVKTELFLDDDSGYEYEEFIDKGSISIEAPGVTFYEDSIKLFYGPSSVVSIEILDFNLIIENSDYSPFKYVNNKSMNGDMTE